VLTGRVVTWTTSNGGVATVSSTGQDRVLNRAHEIAEALAARSQLLNGYLAITLRQRLSRRMAEGTALGMALEGLTAATLTYPT
jgi:hypothetical protein